MARKISYNYVYNILSQILTILTPLLTAPYVSRILHADGIGEYSYINSIAYYFTILGMLGINTYGQLKIAQFQDNVQKRSDVFWEIYIVQFLTTSFSIILYCLIGYFVDIPYQAIYKVTVILLISQLFDISWFLQGMEEFKLITRRTLIIKICSIFCIFLFVKQRNDLYLYVIILHLSTFLGNLSLWGFVFRNTQKIKLKGFKLIEHLKGGMLYFIPTIASSIYTVLDKTMIGYITKSAVQSGYYEQAHKIEQIIALILTSINTVTIPRIVALSKTNQSKKISEIQNTSFRIIMIIGFPMTFGMIAISKKLVPTFLGANYDECIPLLRIFSFLIIILGFDNLIGKQYLTAQGKQHMFNRAVYIGAVVNFLWNCFLIPVYGSVGAAVGSVLAEFVILVIFIIYTKKEINYTAIFKACIKYCTLSIIMSVIVYFIGENIHNQYISVVIQIFSGLLIYLTLLVLIKDEFMIGFYRIIRKNCSKDK